MVLNLEKKCVHKRKPVHFLNQKGCEIKICFSAIHSGSDNKDRISRSLKQVQFCAKSCLVRVFLYKKACRNCVCPLFNPAMNEFIHESSPYLSL